ncbi:hypothetical protein [Ekhidna sp.]|uniref:hypothetical protein n=1 Tax=Ekhidna sp. TaxID=2608089 RepID=UPI003297DED7
MHQKEIKKGKVFPFVWPWKSAEGQSLGAIGTIKSRIFSVSYLLIIWSIVGVLGFASTRNCEGTWQLAFQCEYAFWAKHLTSSPLIYFRNSLTTLFFHNGLDHLLFVSVLGILIIIQSHEAHYGHKATLLIFMSAYALVAPVLGSFYVIGLNLYPDSWFFQFAFERNWMGGSLGMFQVYGALANRSRKPHIMLGLPIVFETFNLTVLEIDPHISIMHLTSTFSGYLLSKYLVR